MTGLIPLYFRREPTTDRTLLEMCPKAKRFDVVAYSDPDMTQRKARWPWYYRKPDRRFKRVTLNCWQWQAVWCPDVPHAN